MKLLMWPKRRVHSVSKGSLVSILTLSPAAARYYVWEIPDSNGNVVVSETASSLSNQRVVHLDFFMKPGWRCILLLGVSGLEW